MYSLWLTSVIVLSKTTYRYHWVPIQTSRPDAVCLFCSGKINFLVGRYRYDIPTCSNVNISKHLLRDEFSYWTNFRLLLIAFAPANNGLWSQVGKPLHRSESSLSFDWSKWWFRMTSCHWTHSDQRGLLFPDVAKASWQDSVVVPVIGHLNRYKSDREPKGR